MLILVQGLLIYPTYMSNRDDRVPDTQGVVVR